MWAGAQIGNYDCISQWQGYLLRSELGGYENLNPEM